MKSIVVIAHNMRSTYNVGSLLRTADAMGVDTVYLTGYTAHPWYEGDTRLPHVSEKLTKQIHKTALGAADSIHWKYQESVEELLSKLSHSGYQLVALEQTNSAVSLPVFTPPDKVALLLGTEVTGVPTKLLERADTHIEIPMFGSKESLNVVQAAAIALYHLRFT